MIHNLESNAESADIILLILKIIAVAILLLLSSIFSGLNLGLLSLDKINLQILNDLGTDTDRSRVKKIMKNLTSPVVSFLISTVLTVFIGEIIPQAICCKYGLAIGAALWWLVFFFMIILSPFVFPLGYILDKILGQEVGSTYNRKQLKKLIEIHMREDIMDKYGEEGINKTDFIFLNDAFEFGNKTAHDVMTKIEDVFLLDTTDILDQELIEHVVIQGRNHIPVCEPIGPDYNKHNTNNILGYIETKDLLLLYNQQHDGQFDQEMNLLQFGHIKENTLDPPTPFTPINQSSQLTIGQIFNEFGHDKVQILSDTYLPKVLKHMKRSKTQLVIVYTDDNSNEFIDPISYNEGILTREDIAKVFIGDEDEDDEQTESDNDFDIDEEKDIQDLNNELMDQDQVDERNRSNQKKDNNSQTGITIQNKGDIIGKSKLIKNQKYNLMKEEEGEIEISGATSVLSNDSEQQTQTDQIQIIQQADNQLGQEVDLNKEFQKLPEKSDNFNQQPIVISQISPNNDINQNQNTSHKQLSSIFDNAIDSYSSKQHNSRIYSEQDLIPEISTSTIQSTSSLSMMLTEAIQQNQYQQSNQQINKQQEDEDEIEQEKDDDNFIGEQDKIQSEKINQIKEKNQHSPIIRQQDFPIDNYSENQEKKLKLKKNTNKSKNMINKMQQQNASLHLLWRMVPPSIDFSSNRISQVAEQLMHTLWLFQDHQFADSNQIKNKTINIAKTCGYTLEHMKQLVKLSTVFVVPSWNKRLSSDQAPLRCQICQQQQQHPEIILILNGSVEVRQKDFITNEVKLVKLVNNDINTNQYSGNYYAQNNIEENENKENLENYYSKGTIINQSRLSQKQIERIATVVKQHAEKEINEIIEKDLKKSNIKIYKPLNQVSFSPLHEENYDQLKNEIPKQQTQLDILSYKAPSTYQQFTPIAEIEKESSKSILTPSSNKIIQFTGSNQHQRQLINQTQMPLARKTIKRSIDLLFAKVSPYNVAVVGSKPATCLFIKKQDFYSVVESFE